MPRTSQILPNSGIENNTNMLQTIRPSLPAVSTSLASLVPGSSHTALSQGPNTVSMNYGHAATTVGGLLTSSVPPAGSIPCVNLSQSTNAFPGTVPMSYSNSNMIAPLGGVVPQAYYPINVYSPEMSSLPPLGKFSGENESESGEQFADWIEQFELVASAYRWDNHSKLVNLTTRLRGQAFAFYRSCNSPQWKDCDTLVKKRFTPVRLQAVQSSLFHDHRQKPNESVDVYA